MNANIIVFELTILKKIGITNVPTICKKKSEKSRGSSKALTSNVSMD